MKKRKAAYVFLLYLLSFINIPLAFSRDPGNSEKKGVLLEKQVVDSTEEIIPKKLDNGLVQEIPTKGMASGTGIFLGELKARSSGFSTILDVNGIINADNDEDGIMNVRDNCPEIANAKQSDRDRDGVGDVCDNCLRVANPGQEDYQLDGVGDACQDSDGDTVLDVRDNCIEVINTDQADNNSDGIGDACDRADCPEPEFSTVFTRHECHIYRADTCGDVNEGNCIIFASENTPVAVDNFPGYAMTWRSRNTTSLNDSCGHLGTVEDLAVRNMHTVTTRFEGETRGVSFNYGDSDPIFYVRDEGTFLLHRPPPHAWLNFTRYDPSTQRFEQNTTRLADPSWDAPEPGLRQVITGTMHCNVRAFGACNRYKDFQYFYSCIPR